MTRHHYLMDDCSMLVPEGFRDLTSHTLSWPMPDGSMAALVVQRETRPGGPPELSSFVEDQTRDYPLRFSGFLLETNEVASGEAAFPMHRKAFRWHSDPDVLYHHQAFILVDATIVVITAAAKAAHRDAIDALLGEVLESFGVRAP